MTKFLLIRHATNDTVGKRLAGRMAGVSLNEEGRLQAQQLADRLAGVEIAAIYSSPLERAIETAEPIAKLLNKSVEVSEDFVEIEFGAWTNLTFGELREQLDFQRFNTFRSCAKIPGGELMLEAQLRMIRGLEKLREKHVNSTVAVVGHADLIRSVVAYYAGIHIDLFHRLEISPASVSVVQVGDDWAKILLVNHTGAVPFKFSY